MAHMGRATGGNRARAVPLAMTTAEAQHRRLLRALILLFALAALGFYFGMLAHHHRAPLPHPRLLLSDGVVHVGMGRAAG